MSTPQRAALSSLEKDSPKTKPARQQRLVLLGGGHVHVQVLRHFKKYRPENIDLLLISEEELQLYSGMLPGLMGGYYTREECQFDLRKICDQAQSRFVRAKADGVDTKRQVVKTDNGEFEYDLLSINVGSRPELTDSDSRATSLKPLHLFFKRWSELLNEPKTRLAILGGGASGFEVGLMAAAVLKDRVSIYEKSNSIVSNLPERAARIIKNRAEELNLKIVTGFSGDTKKLDEDVIFLALPAQAPKWFRDTQLPLSPDGFVIVDEHLNVLGHPNIFAAGDCIHFTRSPHAHAGVYAVRHSPILIENILHRLGHDQILNKFEPQKDFLHLITLGGRRALLIRRPICFESSLNWHLKDYIDRRYMRS